MAERTGTIVLSALVAHTAWHWMTDRFDVLRQFPWPAVTAAGLVSGMRWLMLLVAIAGVYLVWRARASNWAPSAGTTPEDRSEVAV